MNPQPWEHVKEVLYAAIERPNHERAQFLDGECGGDLVLRQEVESLISSYERSGGLLDRPRDEAIAELLVTGSREDLIGQKFGGYHVISLLGAGGMGDVYLAEDIRLGRKVALKLLPAIFTNDADRLRRFQQEARAASALNHPNILTIHDVGEIEGRNFISTEFIEGETLRDRVRASSMTVDEVLDVAIQTASALVVAHRAGIVHRDIKPENIMLRHDGYVKVLDFGLAKLTEQREEELAQQAGPAEPADGRSKPREPAGNGAATRLLGKTGTGALMGTARYMSPEQARGLKIDERTDIWSLGVVFYEMLAGRRPFSGDSVEDYISSILTAEPPPLSQFVEGVPVRLDAGVRKCLEKERRRRYQTARELVKDLSEIKRDQGRLEPRTKRERRRPLAIVFGAAVLFALLLTVATLLYTPFPGVEVGSIAVLPLTDLSGERADDYFADGMTVALINELGHVGELRVISPTSAMRYKDSQETLPQIARELNVDAIVEGTVLRSGARVRTAVKLTHASTGLQLWADSYERDARDVLTMQQQVVRDIVGEIRVKLTPREQSRLTSARPINPEAHEAYLKGRQHLDKRNVEAIKTSIGYFNEAVAKDPGFALPQAALADAYFALGTVNLSALPPLEALERGRVAALRAIELDATLAEGHTALAVIKFYSWEWAEAEEGFNRALELNPNYAPAHSWYAIYSAARGRLGEAIARIYRARDIDPLSPHIAQNAGWILHYARQYDEAIEQYQRALELDPNFLFARLRLAKVYSRKGMYDETIAQLARINTLPERTPAVLAELGYTYGVSGRKREAEQILKQLMEMREQKYVNPSHIARVHIGLGHKEQAFEWLEKAYREHSYGMVFLKMDTEFDPIRNDPRFTQLLQRVGLD